ncbi:putative HTH-type transcriptional regulator YcxD [Anaerocolumna cellulosilytica]|uniref:Putative HTH-type transcriptional regulator YcxD n=1 Tax=Anaerocolumna cellulosilytica TaxID=433286 RepID=A0A6S6R799_9FIRM|nr:PLP-dependent aminotransferase family protein [Anaerocolumna cellulosilytica]MBB5193893.1 DNA-binding transcriptional MocR family regulator [Anaerocolumna cellulosilytica]BCJ94891.1 putative HTH-type transcriptional regulator YcxD [Anaerocolumna cellulosilytica]
MLKMEMVKKYIMDEIKQRKIMEGQRIPGCREIAQTLCVNKITVNKAYKALEEEHFLYCVPRGGYYVIKSYHENKPLSKTIDFQTVAPDFSLIPYQSFTHAINVSIEENKKKLFLYEPPMGFTELRESLKERFTQTGIYASISQIIVTNGAQQGINLALKSIFGFERDGRLLVESPTYHAIHDMAKALNIDCVTIRRDSAGIDLNELEYIFQTEKVKAFYIIPRFHNPTGYTLSENNKSKIADLCSRYRILMIEDDYLADLGMDKRCLPLHYYDTNQITIYIRSFSKTFLPGIRLGAMVVPDTLSNLVIQQKYLSDICTSGIVQCALNFFLTSGMYDRHIHKVNTCYRQKLVKAKAILSHVALPGLSFHVPKQGLFLWISLPIAISAELIAKKLVHENILVTQYHISKDGHQGIRLCIAGVTKEDLDALETVIKVIREEMSASL